jgi:hypothetical protein
MTEFNLKKIENIIDESLKKKTTNFNLELLVNFTINKLNSNTYNEENAKILESILIVNYFLFRN